MPLMVGMTAVSTQTPTPPTSDTVQPVAGATTAPVTPSGDNATPNPNNANTPAANLETPTEAGGGVDLEKMDANAYERYIEGLPADGVVIESEDLGSQSKGTNPAPAAAPVAAASHNTEVQPGEEHEDGVLAPGKLPTRIKVPTDDPLSFHTARLFKESRLAGRQMTLGEAEVLAKQFLGMEGDAGSTTPTEQPGATAPVPTSQDPTGSRLDQLTQELEAATAAFEEAAESFDAKQQGLTLREINRLNREIAEATVAAQREEAEAVAQQADAQTAFLQQWQATEAQVHGMFAHANAADPASPLHQKAAEIQARYRDSQDPAMQAIYRSPASVLLYFTEAANELSIQPGAASAAPVAPPSPVKSTPPPVSRQVPIGAALLATPTGGTKPAAPGGFNVNAITTSHQLEQLIERM